MTLIMVCGQGSVGKSTFIKRYFYNKKNIICISVDEIVKTNKFNQKYYQIYLKTIQKQIDLYENTNKIIVLDFSHDTISSRSKLLNELKFNSFNINFIAIGLHPTSFLDIVINDEKRKNRKLNQDEINKIKNIYNHFQPPTVQEFIDYNFNSIKAITLKNYLIR